MSQQYVGEIRMFAGNYNPQGWLFCNGQLLSISQFEVLFALIGTTYGGDGVNTFALPNLQSRFPVHQGTLAGGSTYTIGEMAGTETVTLTANQLPAHSHQFGVPAHSGAGNSSTPAGHVRARAALGSGTYKGYRTAASNPTEVSLASPSATGNTGGGGAHDNMSPYLAVNFIMAWTGIFPTRS